MARRVLGRPALIGVVTPGNSTNSRSGSTGRVIRSDILLSPRRSGLSRPLPISQPATHTPNSRQHPGILVHPTQSLGDRALGLVYSTQPEFLPLPFPSFPLAICVKSRRG